MILPRWARKFYEVALQTTPALPGGTTWDASFDDGATWIPGVLVDGYWQWLVAGPDYQTDQGDPTPTKAVIARYTIPWLRFTDAPEVDGIHGPPIEVTRHSD